MLKFTCHILILYLNSRKYHVRHNIQENLLAGTCHVHTKYLTFIKTQQCP
jgi:hypothetical protein